jgi:thiol peroxidase
MTIITLKGLELETNGKLPKIGEIAPNFKLVNKDLKNITLDNYKGKIRLLNIVPSLDTPVCASSARKFNEIAYKLNDNIVILVISADLPFAAGRFCKTEGLDNIETLSMMRSQQFARDYGILIENEVLEGLCARTIVIINENDEIIYTELVKEVTNEPNYSKAINKVMEIAK